MPVTYSSEAVEECRKLYLKYNGQNYALIEKEMRRRWPKWSKSLLISVKKTKQRAAKPGWPDKYGWDALLEKKLEIEIEKGGLTRAERLYQAIRNRRELLEGELESDPTDDKLLQRHNSYCALEERVLSRLDLERGSYEGFVEFYEWLCSNVAEESTATARGLLEISEAIRERAKRFYGVGKQREEEDG
jgi:hypothetical protein